MMVHEEIAVIEENFDEIRSSDLPQTNVDFIYRRTLSYALTTVPNSDGEMDRSEVALSQSFENEFRRLGEMFLIRNTINVAAFLDSAMSLMPVLFEAPGWIDKYFPGSISILEVHNDPEENAQTLFIVIKNSYSAQKAVEAQTELLKSWFIPKMGLACNMLALTEEPL